jgi:NAD(P)-dependent dehydrogenase (short-subunit alcohol dehydrogenase family)
LALANAVVPEMIREGWGRIVNVTTSLGTMLNAGSPTYGRSKAALEALSAIMAGLPLPGDHHGLGEPSASPLAR